MELNKSIEAVKKAIVDLREDNQKIPIIVEGEKDISALHRLEINGKIITINSGCSLTDFCDRIAKDYKEIIVLTDWDRKGGFLAYKIRKNLEGRVICNMQYREIFAKNAMIKTVEGLPSWIHTMDEKILE
jgi:5S rRNA maturation endonuclease (ribonuclease M5)